MIIITAQAQPRHDYLYLLCNRYIIVVCLTNDLEDEWHQKIGVVLISFSKHKINMYIIRIYVLHIIFVYDTRLPATYIEVEFFVVYVFLDDVGILGTSMNLEVKFNWKFSKLSHRVRTKKPKKFSVCAYIQCFDLP